MDHLANIKRIQAELAEQVKGPITREFLLGLGFEVKGDFPLFTDFRHKSNRRLYCTIGKYGEFAIAEYHWCNSDEVVRQFSTINDKLTIMDYFTIAELLGIKYENKI